MTDAMKQLMAEYGAEDYGDDSVEREQELTAAGEFTRVLDLGAMPDLKRVPNCKELRAGRPMCGLAQPITDPSAPEAVITRPGIAMSFDALRQARPGASLRDTLTSLRNYFTIRHKNIMGMYEQRHLLQVDKYNKRVVMPRFGGLRLLQHPDVQARFGMRARCRMAIGYGERPRVPFAWEISLRDNQPLVAQHLMQHYYSKEALRAGRGGAILNLEAGQGKTYVAMHLMSRLQYKTLVVCHNSGILRQWVKVLRQVYPNNTVGEQWGKCKTDGDIVVAVINSLQPDVIKYRPRADLVDTTTTKKTKLIEVPYRDFFKRFGFVIYDECHEYRGKKRALVLQRATAQAVLGLSATPDESHHDRVIHAALGEIVDAATLPGYSVEDIPFKGRVLRLKYTGPPEFTQTHRNVATGTISVPLIMNDVCKDKYRMRLIAREAVRLHALGKNLFIFADRVQYLKDLAVCVTEALGANAAAPMVTVIETEAQFADLVNVLPDDQVTSGELHTVTGGATEQAVERAEQEARIILTTYQFMGTGKSIPKMNSVILSTPRRSRIKQFVGRVFRLGSNYDIEREIVDLVDWGTPLKNQWGTRKKYYVERGFPIVEENVSWERLSLSDDEDDSE